jgi:hypothetical protein
MRPLRPRLSVLVYGDRQNERRELAAQLTRWLARRGYEVQQGELSYLASTEPGTRLHLRAPSATDVRAG